MRPLSRRRFVLGGLAAGALASLPGLGAAEDGALVLAFIPQENPDKLIGDIEVISAWLADEIGMPVGGFVTSDHAAAVEALRNGDADISFMGALPYVIANELIGATVILQEIYRGRPTYTGRIFVRRDSRIEAVADLRGKTIAFADPISESGYLYPLEIFVEAGLLARGEDAGDFFAEVYFAGGYQQAMQAMANGLVEAAGASQYADLLLSPAQQAEVKWIAESGPIPTHTVIARAGLDPDEKARFVAAMLKLNEPAYRDLLKHVYGPDGYVAADPGAYDGVRALARAYDLID